VSQQKIWYDLVSPVSIKKKGTTELWFKICLGDKLFKPSTGKNIARRCCQN